MTRSYAITLIYHWKITCRVFQFSVVRSGVVIPAPYVTGEVREDPFAIPSVLNHPIFTESDLKLLRY
jgi:hypothetical protein